MQHRAVMFRHLFMFLARRFRCGHNFTNPNVDRIVRTDGHFSSIIIGAYLLFDQIWQFSKRQSGNFLQQVFNLVNVAKIME